MTRIIDSVEVISQHPDGTDWYRVGHSCGKHKIADIIEADGVFQFFNEKDELLMEVRNCPVVVRYKEESEANE